MARIRVNNLSIEEALQRIITAENVFAALGYTPMNTFVDGIPVTKETYCLDILSRTDLNQYPVLCKQVSDLVKQRTKKA